MAKTIKVNAINCKDYHEEPVKGASNVDAVSDVVVFNCDEFKLKEGSEGGNATSVDVVHRLKESGFCRGRCQNDACDRRRV